MKAVAMLALLLALAGPAAAAIYQCRDAKGNYYLTDDPDNLPSACRQEDITVREEQAEKTGGETPSPDRMETSRTPSAPPPQALPGAGGRVTRQPTATPGRPPIAGDTSGDAGTAAPIPSPPVAGPPRDGTPGTAERGESAQSGRSAADTGTSPATVRGPAAAATAERQLDRWRDEARELTQEYIETEAGVPGEGAASTTQRLRQVQDQVSQFLDRLNASPLAAEEKAAISRELPPQAIGR